MSKTHILHEWWSALILHAKAQSKPTLYPCSQIDYTVVQPSGNSSVFLHARISSDCRWEAECVHECRHDPTLQQSFPAAAISSSRLVSAIRSPGTSVRPLLILSSSQLVKKLTTCNFVNVVIAVQKRQLHSIMDLPNISKIMHFVHSQKVSISSWESTVRKMFYLSWSSNAGQNNHIQYMLYGCRPLAIPLRRPRNVAVLWIGEC